LLSKSKLSTSATTSVTLFFLLLPRIGE
jgi:hypothetical protein